MAFWLLICLAAGQHLKEGSWLITSLSDVNSTVTDRGGSCGLSIGLDSILPCVTECSRFCGMDQSDPEIWTRSMSLSGSLLEGPALNLLIGAASVDSQGSCLFGNPLCVTAVGARSVYATSRELSLETGYSVLSDGKARSPWIPFGKPIPGVDKDSVEKGEGFNADESRVVQYHRTILLSGDDLKGFLDPMRLSHVSIRTSNRYLPSRRGRYEEYIRVGRESKQRIDADGTDMSQWESFYYPAMGTAGAGDVPPIIYDGSIYFNTKAKRRLPRAAASDTPSTALIGQGGGLKEYVESGEDTAARSELPGRSQLLSSIHALVQQWFLRYGTNKEEPMLAITISRAYPAYSKSIGEKLGGQRVGEAGVNINSGSFNSSSEADAYTSIESFTALSYGGLSVSPLCADRSNCASCAATGQCAWCDMSGANVKKEVQTWAGWFGASKSRRSDGSACGIPPQVCIMMGGEPSVSTCPVTWKEDWDLYRD